MGLSSKNVLFIHYLLLTVNVVADEIEPTCYSRFDYDHKVMKSLLTMEIKVEQMEEVINQQKKIIDELTKEARGTLFHLAYFKKIPV